MILIFLIKLQILFSNYEALYNIYTNTNGIDWIWQTESSSGTPWNFTGYPSISNDTDPCTKSWQGIICAEISQPEDCGNVQNGCYIVQQLLLDSYSLRGTLSPFIGNLTMLKNLSLSTNFISGPIPSALGALSLIEYLSLYDNLVN